MRDLLVLLLLVCAAASARRIVSRSAPNPWFQGLTLQDLPEQGQTLHAPNYQCCHAMSFQEALGTGEELAHVVVPYDMWWRIGGVRLSVAFDRDAPATPFLSVGAYGLHVDGSSHGEVFLRVQCAYECCLRRIAVNYPRASAVGGDAVIAGTGDSTQRRGTVLTRNSAFTQLMSAAPAGVYPVDYTWAPHTMCANADDGLWIRVPLQERGEYAISALDLCFINHELSLDWDNGLCEEDLDPQRK